MAIDYQKFLQKMSPGVWYGGDELDALWKVKPLIRRARATSMYSKGWLDRQGKTVNVQYKLGNPDNKKTKKKKVPLTTLDGLIAAATLIGTENELLRKALQEAKTLIEKALEVTK